MSSGDKPSVSVRLKDRDRRILTGHFPAYHVTTHEALHRARLSAAGIDAVKKWTLRMREGGWIAEAPLWSESTVYFRLTADATQLLQLPSRLGRPLTPHNLARKYGVLSFCLLGQRTFRKLTLEEFTQSFGELVSPDMENEWYYLDPDFEDNRWTKAKRLGFVYVDTGQRLRDIRNKYLSVLGQRQRHQTWYHEIIKQGRFLFAVVTTSSGKRNQILNELASEKNIPIRVEVRPDFMDVMPQKERESAEA